jgi:hypothetical protein
MSRAASSPGKTASDLAMANNFILQTNVVSYPNYHSMVAPKW